VKVEEKPSIEVGESFTYAFPACSVTIIKISTLH